MYRLIPAPLVTPALLARAPRRSTIESAVADMGTGVVIAEDGHLAAFHERHLDMVTRLAEIGA